jgi:hypothetical protein
MKSVTWAQVQRWAQEGRVEVTMEPTRGGAAGGVVEVRFTASGKRAMFQVEA